MSSNPPQSGPSLAQVRQLRHSSRLLVRVLGLMQGHLPDFDCTPAQCHVLLELEARGRLRSSELAELLEVDKSSASRSLGQLERRGLVTAEVDPADLRSRPVRLSEQGRERVARIQAESDAQVHRALSLLTDPERQIVLEGVSLYERALHRAKALAEVTIRPAEASDDPQLAELIHGVLREFGATGPGTAQMDGEVISMHAAYSAERSAYFVAERAGVLLAGAGLGPLNGDDSGAVCELRKMHALPEARGLGLGRALLERCLQTASEMGYQRCYLETLGSLQRAIALYEKAGFQPLDAPLGDTGHFTCDRWYVLDLESPSTSDSPV